MKIEPAYLLLGPESGEKAKFIKSLKADIEKSNGAEEYRFYPFETDITEIVGILRNGSLFADFRIVTLYQVETITKKDEIDLLLSYVKQPAEGTLLLLISEENQIDKRLKSKFPDKYTKMFWEMFENKKHEWVGAFFTKNRKSIGNEAIDLILELVENNTLDLQRECKRLVFYYQDKPEIEAADIETFLYHSKQENVFSLFDKIALKDFEGSLEIAEKLLLSGEASIVQLFAGMLWQFKRLQIITYYVSNNYSFEEACRKGKVYGKKVQATYHKAMKLYDVRGIEQVISLLSRYDLLIRETKADMAETLFTLFLYSCIKKNGEEAPALTF